MRVTNNSIFNSLLSDINRNREQLAKIQNKVASGKSVEKPSDGGFAYSRGQSIQELLQKNERYQANIDEGMTQARQAQFSLDKMLDELANAKQQAVRGANETLYTDSDFEILADNVASIKENIQVLANTKSGDRYLFSGTATQTQAFTESGGTVSYNGNSDALSVQISDSAEVNVGVDGTQLTSVFSTLENLEQALRNEDGDQVNALLDDVDAAVNTVSSLSADVGSNINKMDFVYQQFEDAGINSEKELSRLVDTDYAEALANLQKYQVAYQSALEANSRLIQTSLVNLLR